MLAPPIGHPPDEATEIRSTELARTRRRVNAVYLAGAGRRCGTAGIQGHAIVC